MSGNSGRPTFKTQRSSSVPTPKTHRTGGTDICTGGAQGLSKTSSPTRGVSDDEVVCRERAGRGSISNESNLLLDPEILTDYPTQALLLTVLATLVRNTTDETESRILYEYLAESSVVFPKVFPVMYVSICYYSVMQHNVT